MSKTALVAVGGNSLIRAGEKGTSPNSWRMPGGRPRRWLDSSGWGIGWWSLTATGRKLERSCCARNALRMWFTARRWMFAAPPARAKSVTCWSSRCATNLPPPRIDIPVVSMVTQTVVSPDDPAMQHPTKPIGPFYSRADAEEKRAHARLAHRGGRGARLPAGGAFAGAAGDCGAGHHPLAGGARGAGGLDRGRRNSGDSRQRRVARGGSGHR